jgi:hypothetical protein
VGHSGPDHDHDDVESAIVHVHFDAISVPRGTQGSSQVSDSDADHASRSLDTFKAIPQVAVFIAVCPQSSAFVFQPPEFSATVLEAIVLTLFLLPVLYEWIFRRHAEVTQTESSLSGASPEIQGA